MYHVSGIKLKNDPNLLLFIFLSSHSSQQGQENSNTSQNATEPDDLDDDLDEDLDDDEDVMKLRRNQSTAVILLGKNQHYKCHHFLKTFY